MCSLIIAGAERSPDLERNSLHIQRELTYQIDTCNFQIKNPRPNEGDEVVVEDMQERLFAGVVVKVELSRAFSDKSVTVWRVECDDYTAQLDRLLVVETYENKTADDIFRDIALKYAPGFTVYGVKSGAPTIESSGTELAYVRPSDAFKWLCDFVGWHWEPTYYKDLRFFNAEELATPAPMTLEPGGKFVFGKHRIDTQGLRNRVYVRGGTMLSDLQNVQWKADGVARVWTLPWGPHSISFMVNETPKSVGVENLHDESSFDYMMNFNEKYIRCSAQTPTPDTGITMSLMAKQDIAVITIVEDYQSQSAIASMQGGDGIYEHEIIDDNLVTVQAAEAAGLADLRMHANPKVSGKFTTEVNGWHPGQLVKIDLPDRGITGEFLVQKVTLDLITSNPSTWRYSVSYGGRLLGVADVLKALISNQQKSRNVQNQGQAINKIVSGNDAVNVADNWMDNQTRPLPFYVGDVDAIVGLVEVSNG